MSMNLKHHKHSCCQRDMPNHNTCLEHLGRPNMVLLQWCVSVIWIINTPAESVSLSAGLI